MHLYIFTLIALIAAMGAPGGSRDQAINPNRLLASIGFFWLSLLAAFRYDTGTDFHTYREIWRYAPALSEVSVSYIFLGYLEPLFVATNALLKAVSEQEMIFYAAYGALTMYGVSRAIAQYRINQVYACLVYFCVFYLPYTFNAMRQALAMSLFLLALRPILQGRVREVWLIGVVATGFHFSGVLIIFSFYYLRVVEYFRFSPRVLFIGGSGASLAVGLSGLGGMLYFGVFSGKLETYSELFSEGTSLVNVAVRLALAGLLIFYGTAGQKDEALHRLLKIYLLGLFLYLSLLSFNVLGTRFNMFLRVLEVLLIPAVCMRLGGLNRVCFFVLTTCLLLVALFSVALHPDYSYQTIFGQ
jgi:hypothetical protein